MRISTKQSDPGHAKFLEWFPHVHHAKIYLNGVEQKHNCITADEELGEVHVYVLDEDGRPVMDGDEWRTEWRRGRVEIVMPEREAA